MMKTREPQSSEAVQLRGGPSDGEIHRVLLGKNSIDLFDGFYAQATVINPMAPKDPYDLRPVTMDEKSNGLRVLQWYPYTDTEL